MEPVCPIEGCHTPRSDTSLARKAHCAAHHGYPVCPTCLRKLLNINMFEAHMQQDHRMLSCALCSENYVKGMLKTHLTTHHGYPDCLRCGRNTFSNTSNFVSHVLTHTNVNCCFDSCATVLQRHTRAEQAHYRDVHNYPDCIHCGKTVHIYTNFMVHARACSILRTLV